MKIILDGTVESLRTRLDGSVVFSLSTQEMDADSAGRLFQLRNKYVKCLLSDSNISPLEEKLVDQENIKGSKKAKTPSQRLRGVIYRVWEQEMDGDKIDFETYYKQELEQMIEQYKTILNNETSR